MGILSPYIHVECDRCEEVTDGMELTALAGGDWDARNIKPTLIRQGWKVDGDITICPECQKTE